jgi:gliding motility-associated-like protein
VADKVHGNYYQNKIMRRHLFICTYLFIYCVFVALPLKLFANGNHTLGPSYSNTAVGLNYVSASGKAALRYTATPGTFPTTLNVSGIPAGATIVKAFLYSIAGYNPTAPTSVTNTLVDPTGATTNFNVLPEIGLDGPKCWGETGNACYRADVTAAITGNGTYTASNSIGGDPTDGFTLIIIYTEPNAGYIGSIFIDDGLVTQYSGLFGYTTAINGVTANTQNARGFVIFSDVQDNVGGTTDVYINGNKKSCSRNFWNFEEVPTTLADAQTSVYDSLDMGSGDCIAVALFGTYFQRADTSVIIKQPFNDTLLCTGDTVHIDFDVTSKFRPGNVFTFRLSNIYGHFPGQIIGKVNTDTAGSFTWVIPDSIPAGLKYRIDIVSSGPAKTSNDNGIDIVIRNNGPRIKATNTAPVCEGEGFKLKSTDSNPGAKFEWSGPDGFADTLQNTELKSSSLASGGVYTVKVTVLNGCVRRDTTNVVIHPLPADLQIISNNPLCPVDTLTLQASTSSADVTYQWSGPDNFKDTIPNPVIKNTRKINAGKYTLKATLNGCTKSIDSTITVRDLNLELGDNTVLCKNETMLLNPQVPNASYVWQDGSRDTSFRITSKGVYTVIATSDRCILTDTIIVDYEICECMPFVPSAFTPNADGLNDKVGVYVDCIPKSMNFMILNRFGQKVFTTGNPQEKWDGTYNGTPAEIGTYFYFLQIVGPRNKHFEFKGDITLIR